VNVELRIEVEDSHEAIVLIDDLRAHGLEAELADTPGAWDVVADGPFEEVAEIVGEHVRA
jgi:hypothetical protein